MIVVPMVVAVALIIVVIVVVYCYARIHPNTKSGQWLIEVIIFHLQLYLRTIATLLCEGHFYLCHIVMHLFFID
jgi:hypothetical protein